MAALPAPYDTGQVLDNGDIPKIFPCEICSKPFLRKSSRNRHKYYCRKKILLGRPYRTRPCSSCHKAKTKCTATLPSCSRCIQKKVQCIYNLKVHQELDEPVVPDHSILNLVLGLELGSGLLDQSDLGHNETTPQGRSTTPDDLSMEPQTTPLPSLAGITLHGCTMEAMPSFNRVIGSSAQCAINTAPTDIAAGTAGDQHAFTFYPRNLQEVFGRETMLNTNQTNIDLSFPTAFVTDPRLASCGELTSCHSTVARRHSPFVQTCRPAGSPLGQHFLLETIRVYPKMILECYECHPFIHRSIFTKSGSGAISSSIQQPPESLAICQSIVQIYSTKSEQTSAFFWRTIASEVKRLHTQHKGSTDWNTVAMLQAMTIYILLRVFSEDSFSVDFDNDLVQTMTVIAIEAEASCFLCLSECLGELPQWREWIVMESKRRTVTILFIIHLLFDINPGQRAKALSGLSNLPLPAYKSLWDAPTELEWTRQYKSWLEQREGRSAISYGDMLDLTRNRQSGELDMRVQDLSTWYGQLDAFGVFVMIAATSLSI